MKGNKTKILFRIRSMEMGGVQKVLIDILKNLDREKFEVCLLLNLRQGILVDEIPLDVPVISLAKGKETFSENQLVLKLQLALRLLKLKILKKIPSLIQSKIPFTPDIEVAMFHYNYEEMLNSPFKDSKKIGWFHSGITELLGIANTDKIIKELMLCDQTVHVSKNTMNDVIKHSGGKMNNGIVIHNAFDWRNIRVLANEEKLDFNSSYKTFVSVGRLASQKGYDILLEAHRELIAEDYLHQIIVIGGGSEEQNLREKVSKYQVEETFLLLGQKQNPFPYIAAGDFYLQSSRYEAYPLSVGEAQILGKAIISTNVGGVNELLIHEKTGYIVEPNKDGIKSGIKTFLQNPELVKKIEEHTTAIDFEKKNQEIYRQIESLFLNS